MRRSGGFTLVEVMLTLVIMSIVLGVVYSVFLGTLSSKAYCDGVKDAGHTGQSVLLLLTRDLQGAVALGNGLISLEGVDGSEAGVDADRISFVTTSDTRCSQEKHDVNEVGYFLAAVEEDEEEEETGASEETSTLFRLYRREDPGVDGDPHAGGNEEVLEERVRSLDVQYLDAESGWISQWTGEGLPRAVKVTLVLSRRVQEGRAKDYTFTAVVPMTGAP